MPTTSTSPAPAPAPPSLPRNPEPDIALVAAPALISWSRPDGTIQYVGNKSNGVDQVPMPCWLKCDIRYSSASQTAVFNLKTRVLLKAQHYGFKNSANLFVIIKAEHVTALNLHSHDGHVPSVVRNLLSPDAVCLDFVLSLPPTVIAPQNPDPLVPKNEQAAYILSSLQTLTQQTRVDVFLSHRALSRTALETLCAAASNHTLTHIDQYGSNSSLYGGKGGRILYPLNSIQSKHKHEHEYKHEANAEVPPHIVESPPSYDELGPGPLPLMTEAHAGAAYRLQL